MSQATAKHVFFVLMALGAVGAFVLPRAALPSSRGILDSLLTPVSYPVGKVANWARRRISPDVVCGVPSLPEEAGRTRDEMFDKIESQRAELSRQRQELNTLYEMDKALKRLGKAADYCKPFDVVGGDALHRESITIAGSTRDGIKLRMAVVTADNPEGGVGANLIGFIAVAGQTTSRVQLLTDRLSTVAVRFIREDDTAQGGFIDLAIGRKVIAEGAGEGKLVIRNLSMKETAEIGLKSGDFAVLDDTDWPQELQGQPVGRVVQVSRQERSGTFATIEIHPRINPAELRTVRVMIK